MKKQAVPREKSGKEMSVRHHAWQPGSPQSEMLEQPVLDDVQRTLARPTVASPAGMIALQRSVGNRAVQHLVQRDGGQSPWQEELKAMLARRRRVVAPEDTESVSRLDADVVRERQKRARGEELESLREQKPVTGLPKEKKSDLSSFFSTRAQEWQVQERQRRARQEELESLRGQKPVTGLPEEKKSGLESVLSTRIPDERGLVERGYDPMEQTLYGKPKYLAAPVETRGETEMSDLISSPKMLTKLLTLLKSLIKSQ